MWYVRPPAGGQFGPARGDVMRQWIAEGRVSADSVVWREGWPDWKTAGPIFPGLSQTFAASAEQEGNSAATSPRSLTPPSLSSVENLPPRETRSKLAAPRARGTRKSIATVVCLGLVIVFLLVVLMMVLPWD